MWLIALIQTTYETTCVSVFRILQRNMNSKKLQKEWQNFANLESGEPWSEKRLWDIFQKEFLIEIL